MSIGNDMEYGPIDGIPPLTSGGVDIWGRVANPRSIELYTDQLPDVVAARDHLWSYLIGSYADPEQARQRLDAAALSALTSPHSWDERVVAAERAAETARSDPESFGPLRRRETLARLNAKSLPYLIPAYYRTRALKARQRCEHIEHQIARDQQALPPFTPDMAAFMSRLGELAAIGDHEQGRRAVIDAWFDPGNARMRRLSEAYGAAVRARIGPATPAQYIKAAERAAALFPNGAVVLANLRRSIRVMQEIERIQSLQETTV